MSWHKNYITRSVKNVHARQSKMGSGSEMTCYNLVKALIPTGLTSAAIGTLDIGNRQAIINMLRELIDAHDFGNDDNAVADTQASKLARHINWGEEI